MQSLSAATTAATTIQNPIVSELHMVKAKHNKKETAEEDRSQSAKPATAVGQLCPTQRTAPAEMQNAINVGRRDTLRVAAGQRRKKREQTKPRMQEKCRNWQESIR